ncbi:hypothetical protein [Saccharopolyspora spinosa]|uniref:hypothetical protein n=1 Tax=Saccharopolyspora spinosa TaxID=60894 RepID=UPI00376EFC65
MKAFPAVPILFDDMSVLHEPKAVVGDVLTATKEPLKALGGKCESHTSGDRIASFVAAMRRCGAGSSSHHRQRIEVATVGSITWTSAEQGRS